MVLLLDVHGHMDLNWVRDGFLMVDGDVLLNVHGHWTIDWDLDGVGDMLLHWVWDVLLHGVGLWHGHLHWVRHWLVHMHWHGVVIRHMHGIRDLLDHWVWDGLVDVHGVGLVNMNWHWVVDMDVDGVVHDLLDRVGLRDMDWDLDGHWDFLDDGVRGWHGHLDGVVHVLLHGVGLGNVDLDGHWTIDVHVVWDVDLLLDGVGSGHVVGHLDDLLDWVVDHLLDGVWVRHGHLNGHRDVLLHGNMDYLLDWVRDMDLLHDRHGFLVMVVVVVSAAEGVSSEASVLVSAAEVEQTAFVLFLVSCRRFGLLGFAVGLNLLVLHLLLLLLGGRAQKDQRAQASDGLWERGEIYGQFRVDGGWLKPKSVRSAVANGGFEFKMRLSSSTKLF